MRAEQQNLISVACLLQHQQRMAVSIRRRVAVSGRVTTTKHIELRG